MTNKAIESENRGRPVVVVVGASSKHGTVEEEDSSPPSRNNITINSTRWGLAGAVALPFAKLGYDIVLMGRRRNVLDDIKKMVEEDVASHQADDDTRVVLCVECDVTNDDSVKDAFDSIHQSTSSFGGYIDLVIYNVAPRYPSNFKFAGWGDVLLPHQIDLPNMTLQHDTMVNGLIRISKQVVPGMIERKRGCVLISGESCCNLHGRYEFGSVAPARAAQRSLAQCMFQSYGPMGVHVCTVNIGGIIDTPKTRSWKMRDPLVNPHEIAEQFVNVYQQKQTVWSYEVQLTPSFAARKVDMRM